MVVVALGERFLYGRFNFLDNHKGGVIRNRQEFCMLALHPSDPAYHLLTQDYFVDGKKPVPMFPMDMRRI
jgi:hypothetical protein